MTTTRQHPDSSGRDAAESADGTGANFDKEAS